MPECPTVRSLTVFRFSSLGLSGPEGGFIPKYVFANKKIVKVYLVDYEL
jgi:hypothetical protein